MTLLPQIHGSFSRFLSGVTFLSTPSKAAFSPPFFLSAFPIHFSIALTNVGAFVELDPCL